MGAKSSAERTRTYSNAGEQVHGLHRTRNGGGHGSSGLVVTHRTRAVSLDGVPNGSQNVFNINSAGAYGGGTDSDASTPESNSVGRVFMQASALPLHLLSWAASIKCPVCHKVIPSDDVECHLIMCLTKPRITYNEDILKEDKGECVICFEELVQGNVIARLPCLCVYHKRCIDSWFKVNRSCPEHPTD